MTKWRPFAIMNFRRMGCYKCTEPNTGTLGSFVAIFGTFVTVIRLRLVHQLDFCLLRIVSVFSTPGIIPSEFWYILCLVHQLVH